MRSFANWTRLALIALSSGAMATGGIAHADTPPAGAIPPGWVWQGEWRDGQWNGQWIPGPGMAPGAPMPGAYPPPPEGDARWGHDREHMRMVERCRDHRHDGDEGAEMGERAGRHHRDRDCEALFRDHPQFAQGYPAPQPGYGPAPYGPPPYGQMPYAPMGFMMVPVMTTPQQPCVETRTVTTTYVVEKRRRVIWTHPRRKEKRVYTGS